MIYENGGEYHGSDETTVFACDVAMRQPPERTFFESGIADVVNAFVHSYQPQSYDSFVPIASLIGSVAEYMHEPGDDTATLQTTLIQGLTTGLCVAHDTYNGAIDVDDTLQSIAELCTADEQGRKNINQLVDKAKGIIVLVSKEVAFVLADWRRDYQVPAGQEDVFDIGFAMVLAGAHEKVTQRRAERGDSIDWDSLLGGDE